MKICHTCKRCYEDTDAVCVAAEHGQLAFARPGSRLIAEKYRLDQLLGRGGMGAVYEGTHVELERPVAVKMLLPDSVSDAQALERFRREARAAARINHPNVANTYDYGALADGEAYLIMELVRGQTLREWLNAHGELPIGAAIEIAKQVAEGIAAAHHFEIVHRDLKPSNILLARDHRGELQAKVVDFGIAKLREQTTTSGEPLTAAGALMGTPRYMSPEQCAGLESDARSDIYSLAVILFEMLAGRPPFDAPSATAIALKHVRETPPDIHTLRPNIPPALAALIEQSLAKEPEQRPHTAAEFAARLQEIEIDVAPDLSAATFPARASDERAVTTAQLKAAPDTNASPDFQSSTPGGAFAHTRLHPIEKQTARAGEPTTDTSSSFAEEVSAPSTPGVVSASTETLTQIAAARTPPKTDAPHERDAPREIERGGQESQETATLVRPASLSTIAGGRSRRSFSLMLSGLLAALITGGALLYVFRRPGQTPQTANANVAAAPAATAEATSAPPPITPSPVPSPSAEKPVLAPEQERAALRASIDSWLAAHNARNLSQVSDFYLPNVSSFYLKQNASRAAVRAEKARLFAQSDLSITRASEPQITFGNDGRSATMLFRKSYRSGTNAVRPQSGEVLQEIVWRKTERGWKISGERDLRVLR